MSGETEQHVSGWTVDTLHAHFQQQFDSRQELLDERFATQAQMFPTKIEVDTRLTALSDTLDKLEARVNKSEGEKKGSTETIAMIISMAVAVVAILSLLAVVFA